MPPARTNRLVAVAAMLTLFSPAAGAFTLVAAYLLGGGPSFESNDPPSKLQYLALLTLLLWAVVSYKATRSAGAKRAWAAGAAALAVAWAVGSLALVAALA